MLFPTYPKPFYLIMSNEFDMPSYSFRSSFLINIPLDYKLSIILLTIAFSTSHTEAISVNLQS